MNLETLYNRTKELGFRFAVTYDPVFETWEIIVTNRENIYISVKDKELNVVIAQILNRLRIF